MRTGVRDAVRDLLGITELMERFDNMATKQEIADGLATVLDEVRTAISSAAVQISSGIDGVSQDLQDLKAREDVDLTPLESRVPGLRDAATTLQGLADRLASVDAENPELPPEQPTEPAPSDGELPPVDGEDSGRF